MKTKLHLRWRTGPAMLLLIAALGGCIGGGGGGDDPVVDPPTVVAFPARTTDTYPEGQRIDVSALNLFPMKAGDVWAYRKGDANGTFNGTIIRRSVIAGPDATGQVTVIEEDPSDTSQPRTDEKYTVTAEGLVQERPFHDAPPAAQEVIGAILAYPTPFYPVGSERRHVRGGPWGADIDGDGKPESFELVFTQRFVGFERATFGVLALDQVAHLRTELQVTLRFTREGLPDAVIRGTYDEWFAPGIGLVKSVTTTEDSLAATPTKTVGLLFDNAVVGGVVWDDVAIGPPSEGLDGLAQDLAISHKDLIFDPVRNLYYASIPGAQSTNANAIATIDPASGAVTYSRPVGLDPAALALSPRGEFLYAGLNGSGEVVKLALPGLAEVGRVRLPADPFFGQLRAAVIRVSPVDANVVAASLVRVGVSPAHGGVALIRNLVVQPKRTQDHTGSNLIAFDGTGTALYGYNNETTEFGLRRIEVLPDGLKEERVVPANQGFGVRALSTYGTSAVVGNGVWSIPGLDSPRLISNGRNCLPDRAAGPILCEGVTDFGTSSARILVVDPATLFVRDALVYSKNDVSFQSRLVPGIGGRVAISYPESFGMPGKIRLFASSRLLGG